MPVTVQGPDLKRYQFPDGTTKESAVAYFKKKGIGAPSASVTATPPLTSLAGLKERALTLRDKAVNALPTVGGTVGGLIGGAAGAETGPGAIATAGAGAAAGGGLGETLRQGLTEHFHPEDKKMTPAETLKGIAGQAAVQGGSEIVGQGIGRALKPSLEGTINKLYYSINPSKDGSIEAIMPEITAAEKAKPAKTVQDFLDIVKETKQKVGTEVDASMRTPIVQNGNSIPLSGARADVTPISDQISNLINAHPSNVQMNSGLVAGIKKRASSYASPKTYGWLTDRRIVLNDELNKYYALPDADKSVYLSTHPEFEIDKAEADAIRDVVYPQMDKAAGKPAGYFANLQRKRGALISVENAAHKNIEKLTKVAKTAKGAPISDRVRTYGTSSGRVGMSAKLSSLVHTPNPLAKANKQVARAFQHTPGTKIGSILGTAGGKEVLALPLRALGSPDDYQQEQPQE